LIGCVKGIEAEFNVCLSLQAQGCAWWSALEPWSAERRGFFGCAGGGFLQKKLPPAKRGNVIQEDVIMNGTVCTTKKAHDWFGKALSITTPDNQTVQYGYNAAGQLVHVGTPQNPKAFVRDIVYTQDKRRGSITYGNGVTTEYAYDDVRDAIESIQTKNAAGTMLQHQKYAFDAVGNITSIQHKHPGPTGGGSTAYTYDALGRLKTDNASGYNEAVLNESTDYAWSPRGNILSKTGIGNYQWNDTTRKLTSITDPATGSTLRSYDWDDRGNLSSRTINVPFGEGTQQYSMDFTFSADNRMVNATNTHTFDEGGLSVDFAYDYTGRRIRKTSNLGNNFRYVNSNYAEKYYAVNDIKTVTTHVFAGDERVATLVDGEAHFIHRDHINTGGAITSDGGEVKDRIAFTSHGEIKYQLNPSSELEEKFTGQIYDPETGLYYYNARYYDPEVGIFISPDTMVPDGYRSQDFNRYMYCAGNPILYVDPTGHAYWIYYDINEFPGQAIKELLLPALFSSAFPRFFRVKTA
jgi:RHS repeat-associated protein